MVRLCVTLVGLDETMRCSNSQAHSGHEYGHCVVYLRSAKGKRHRRNGDKHRHQADSSKRSGQPREPQLSEMGLDENGLDEIGGIVQNKP